LSTPLPSPLGYIADSAKLMNAIALLLRLLLLLYYPFLALLWLGIVAIEYFLLVNKWSYSYRFYFS
jgi:hypothetical protein